MQTDSEHKKSQEEFAASTSASHPSPLHCPRRTFLASVILGSKVFAGLQLRDRSCLYLTTTLNINLSGLRAAQLWVSKP